MHNLRLYYGKDTKVIDNHEASHTVKVVTTLTNHLRDKGYDLYIDRFYTSPLLADALQQMVITLTGTVLSNKRGLPVEIKTKQKIPKGTTESYRCRNMMALAWQDKRKILMLSTKYTNKMIEIQLR